MPKLSRQTEQKTLLQKELSNLHSFFTAEDLHNKVKNNSIGIATVYRFLKELKNKNELHSYICDRRFIYSKNKSNHCHFTCQECSKVIHIDIDSIDFMKKNVKGDICHFQIDVEGICKDCQNKKKLKTH